ncbi:ABC transporter ATP-binding protein [Microlunatus sp. GCM10028923]|uniref:ABC transporter ATP-binding protein n=1 Tax=Microlunatus sp. GCM10028923 TaxID=3273400 RepID=UPI00360BFEC8
MLELDDVSRTFRGGAGVTGLALRVEPGEIVALVGLNGAGKTTLMRLALGMLRPDRGVVRIAGAPLPRVPRTAWRRVGQLVEVPLAYRELTVRQNLRLAADLHAADPGCVAEALATWRLDTLAGRRTGRLSLGNRQRVGLAAALQHDPTLVILDEPSNSLDPAAVLILRDVLRRRAAAGTAVLVSSHHLDEVARIADRILLINGGRLIGELDPSGSELERAFFDRIHADDQHRTDGDQA